MQTGVCTGDTSTIASTSTLIGVAGLGHGYCVAGYSGGFCPYSRP